MNQYLATNPRYTGEAVLTYNEGLLLKIDFSRTNMTPVQITAFKQSVPALETDLKAAFTSNTDLVLEEIVPTFEEFWIKYDHKFNKPRVEALWERLSKTHKVKAHFGIDVYNRYLERHPTQAKMHPDTWLRTHAWTNNYSKH